jgi:GT2 family glycosyltransferase
MEHLIIVPIYNNPHLTRRCLESIFQTTDLKKNLLFLIDDHSNVQTKKLLEKFKEQHPEIILYRNKKNLGKPKSLNFVLKRFSKMDYYTIIDNDVYLKSKNWAKILIKAHQDWNNRAILGAHTYMDGFPFIKNFLYYFDPWPYWTLAGCFFSFSQKIFKTVGYFYDKTLRGEDSDYCRRAYLAGFRWFYINDIKAGISDYKHPKEKLRLKRNDILTKKRKRAWSDYVMRTHKIHY